MFEQLFGSRTRYKLLNLFLTNEGRSFYVREITRLIEEQINSVRRELFNLQALGILLSKNKNGKLYYHINEKSEIFSELKAMFAKFAQEMTQDKSLAREVRKLGTVYYAARMGQFVNDQTNNVDLFLVGDIDKKKLNNLMKEWEKEAGKEINYTILTLGEYEDRKLLFDRFLMEIFSSPKEVIIDNIEVNV